MIGTINFSSQGCFVSKLKYHPQSVYIEIVLNLNSFIADFR